MAKINIGDTVRFLNSVGGGKVTRLDGQLVYVEDEDGFEVPALQRECVVVALAGQEPAPKTTFRQPSKEKETTSAKGTTSALPANPPVISYEPEELPVEEVEGGDSINLTVAFEPRDIKQLSTTTYDTYVVNDSNYYLYVVLMTRVDEDTRWTMRYAGIIEPNFQVLALELTRDDVSRIEHMAVQYVAFKRDRDFELKKPGLFETKVDNTKFFRVHCFRQNVYFDKDVIAFEIVRNDKICGEEKVNVDAGRLKEEMLKPKSADRRPDRRPVRKNKKNPERRNGDIIEVDLHVSELLDTSAGLSPADILNLQVDTFRNIMDSNLRNKGQKIVFIHGKGEGVLRQALLKELKHRYKGHDVQDASFREYGFGATQVTIR